MNIEAIGALAPHDEVAPPPAVVGADPLAGFGRLVGEGLRGLNESLKVNQSDLQQLALGEAPNLHEVMVRLEESRIAFQLMLQVRNRALEAYQEVMRMQI